MNALRATLIFAIHVPLTYGCASLSGLDGTSSYGCKAPDGIKCDSVSGTYYNAMQNNLPAQRRSSSSEWSRTTSSASAPPGIAQRVRTASTAPSLPPGDRAAYDATPLRASPRVLRLWIKPWEDTDRDLNGESLVYVQIDNGRWLVEHVQRQAREPFAPVRPARPVTPAAKGPSDAGKAAQADGPVDNADALKQALRALQSRSSAATDD